MLRDAAYCSIQKQYISQQSNTTLIAPFDMLPITSPSRCTFLALNCVGSRTLFPSFVGNPNGRPSTGRPMPPVHMVHQSSWPVAIATCPMAIDSPHVPSRPRGSEGGDRSFCTNGRLTSFLFFSKTVFKWQTQKTTFRL